MDGVCGLCGTKPQKCYVIVDQRCGCEIVCDYLNGRIGGTICACAVDSVPCVYVYVK